MKQLIANKETKSEKERKRNEGIKKIIKTWNYLIYEAGKKKKLTEAFISIQ